MRQKLTFLAGLGVGLALVGLLRRRRSGHAPAESPAAELRQRLEASRAATREPEQRLAPEARPSAPPPAAVEEARRRVHEAARAAAEEMRRSGDAPGAR
ncbi:MAG: hypothetical protein KJ051_09490 [Thermoleophilia bacterium]|nr:hypothetical protein [Thermoleophilia bacterium]